HELPARDRRRTAVPARDPLEAGRHRMSALSTPVDVAPAAGLPPRPVRRRTITRRGFAISVIAYAIALIFLLPYLEMIVAALRPHGQLLAANLLPSHFSFSNFTTIWSTGFGGNLV